MATRSATEDRDFRTATTLPETWDEDTRSSEVVFSTGAPIGTSIHETHLRAKDWRESEGGKRGFRREGRA